MNAIVGQTEEYYDLTREEEILEYVKDNKIDKFAAVDDATEMFPSRPDWLIVTNPYEGLTQKIANKLICKLL
jgi:hypothetical protein